jgi:hypothetical protein
MKKNLYYLCVCILVMTGTSCKKSNNVSNGNYLEFTAGNNNYKATSFLQAFDEDNTFQNSFGGSNKGIGGYIEGPGNWLTYSITLNSTLTKVKGISFIDNSGCTGGYFCEGTCNSTPLNVNLNITRNDNTSGGIIEGSFSGTLGTASNSCQNNNYCIGTTSVNGSFRLIIK